MTTISSILDSSDQRDALHALALRMGLCNPKYPTLGNSSKLIRLLAKMAELDPDGTTALLQAHADRLGLGREETPNDGIR